MNYVPAAAAAVATQDKSKKVTNNNELAAEKICIVTQPHASLKYVLIMLLL